MNTSARFFGLALIAATVSCGSDESPLDTTSGPSSTSTSSTGYGTSGSGGSGGGGPIATAKDCQDYCDQITEYCTDDNAMYSNDGDCGDVCRNFPAGKEGDINSNSLACRSFYLASAPDSPDANCRYAGPGTEGKCGGSCENFCYLAQKVCTGEQQVWQSQAACVQDCQEFAQGEEYVAGATGDNFACRLYQLTLAAGNALEYCRNIGRESEACFDEGIGGNGGGGPGPGGGGPGGGGPGGGGPGGGGPGGGSGTGGDGGASGSTTAAATTAAATTAASTTAAGTGGAGGGI